MTSVSPVDTDVGLGRQVEEWRGCLECFVEWSVLGADWKQCGRELWGLQMTVYLVVARPEDERWECKQVGPSGLSLQRLWPTVPSEPRVRVGFARLTL